jgi:3-oxoacyl-[acyl-carrier protein] reductase
LEETTVDTNLKDKNVIVTGASRGIGLAIAHGFAGEGANVSICARGEGPLDTARQAIAAHGTTVHAAPCDVGDAAALDAYIAAAHTALGGLHVLVNNPSGFGRTDDEEGWRNSIDIDLMASVRASWAAVPLIADAGGGAIVHISSISGLEASTRTPPYGAVKAALIQYTMTQAADLAARNIRVNAIAPGSIEFEGGVWDDAKRNNRDLYDGILASIPFGRMGRPEEVANLAVFLCSDAASWITGQTVAIDGAQML